FLNTDCKGNRRTKDRVQNNVCTRISSAVEIGRRRRMSKIGSGLILLVRPISLGRLLTRNAVPARVHHSTGRHDKSPFLFRLISCCSERGRRTSVLLSSNNTVNTLASRQFLFSRYCCNNKVDDDEKMSAATKREPAAEQLTEYKKHSKGERPVLLTGNGTPIANKKASLTVGSHGPILLQDFVYLDEMSHFARERIPERVVHAKGAGAFGYFEVTHDITRYCKAKVFSSIGKRTPIAVRFSTVGGESGSADTARDPRGFAVKFYTEEGIWDLVGNNTPIFFVKDPLFFPSFIHTQKRNPVTHLKDADMFWDFLSLRTESMHQVMILFSDRGIPDGYRHMNGYGSHTFKLVNAHNEIVYCKFHYKTDQGIKNIFSDKAAEISSSDPDYSIRDLYNAIASNNYPTWTFYIQVMTASQAKNFRWNPFDITKVMIVWPHDEYPLIPVGKLVLDRNPDNYFNDVEQIAFDPAHMVPGIEPSPDKLLQGRLFAYGDTHRHRLGPNHLQLPVNCPYK
ncbi:unnamed protein product, partial [Heterotrigona itama]